MSDFHDVDWNPKAVSRVWDYYAQNSAYANQYFSAHSGRFIYEKIKRRVMMAGGDVLDFGCGPGYFLQCLCEKQPEGRYFGLDFSRDSVEKARNHLDGFSNEELGRILRPGGRLVITTPNKEDLEASKLACPECGCVFHRWQHVRTWNGPQLSALLSDRGFTAVCVEDTYFASFFQRAKAKLRQWLGLGRTTPHLLYIGQKS